MAYILLTRISFLTTSQYRLFLMYCIIYTFQLHPKYRTPSAVIELNSNQTFYTIHLIMSLVELFGVYDSTPV